MPTLTKKYHANGGKLVIINLQPTKQDKKADLIIRTFADSVLVKLFDKLGLEIPEYDRERDPIFSAKNGDSLDWTQTDEETKRVVAMAEKIESEFKEKRKLNRKTKPKTEVEVENGKVKEEAKGEVKTENEKFSENDSSKIEFKIEKDEDIILAGKRKSLEGSTLPSTKNTKTENGS